MRAVPFFANLPPAGATNRRAAPLAFVACLFALVSACDASILGPGPLPLGPWGGPQGNLVVYADSATLDMPCAVARIRSLLATTADGHFEATGFWAPQVGPVGIDGPVWRSARFTGRRDGNLLEMNVQVDGSATFGPLDFKRGVVAQFPRCL